MNWLRKSQTNLFFQTHNKVEDLHKSGLLTKTKSVGDTFDNAKGPNLGKQRNSVYVEDAKPTVKESCKKFKSKLKN